jgi:glycosyltransferase involved in cell wall biosynthesis
MKNNPLVSIVIPTKNSDQFLEGCLRSIKNQSYNNIEIVIVDSGSKDNTENLAKRYHCRYYDFHPDVDKGTFDAPYKRNYGVKKSKGDIIFYVDADMELTKDVIKEAVELINNGNSAVIVAEDSFGTGIWAKAKNLERRCYWGDDNVEAPRFIDKKVWNKLGGLDEFLGGGGDDWDLYQKLLRNGYRVARTKSWINHNEGNLKLSKLVRKRFMYGKDSLKYIKKRPGKASLSYFPIRKSYFKNWKLFISQPFTTIVFIIMRTAEYSAAFAGIMRSMIKSK